MKDICMPKLGKTPSVKEYVHDKITEEEALLEKKLLNTLYVTSPDSYLSLMAKMW